MLVTRWCKAGRVPQALLLTQGMFARNNNRVVASQSLSQCLYAANSFTAIVPVFNRDVALTMRGWRVSIRSCLLQK
jgi:hypothetical protein